MAERQYIQKIDWKLSSLNNNSITNYTFVDGSISQDSFNKVSFSNVYFNGIEGQNRGVTFTSLDFSTCSFNAVTFEKNSAIDLRFYNCTFNGSILNTTNFGSVGFYSDTSNTMVITNGQLTSFTNCIFENCNPPDPPGVLVMGKEAELQFRGVVFEGCRFKGLVRPEWFRNCFFNDSFFPPEFDTKTLLKNNQVYNPQVTKEECN